MKLRTMLPYAGLAMVLSACGPMAGGDTATEETATSPSETAEATAEEPAVQPAAETKPEAEVTPAAETKADPLANLDLSGSFPTARPVPDWEGYVYSPYDNHFVDVKGLASGSLVADPRYELEERKYFFVP